MKSLRERQIDRLQRKADNAEFSTQNEVTGRVGLAAVRVGEAQEALAALTDGERAELREMMDDGFKSEADDETNLYDSNGQLKSAGVGVVNPFIVPPTGIDASEQANGVAASGWAETPPPTVKNDGGSNAAGASLEAQTGDTAKTDDAAKTAEPGKTGTSKAK